MDVGDNLSVPKTTMENAREFAELAKRMKHCVDDILAMQERLMYLSQKAANGTQSREDIFSLKVEADSLLSEIDRLSTTTEYDYWYGLMGGKASAYTAWAGQEDEENKDVAIEIVTEEEKQAIDKNNIELAEKNMEKLAILSGQLEGCIDVSTKVADTMAIWKENNSFHSLSDNEVRPFNNKNMKEYMEIPPDSVIGSSRDNAIELIKNMQTFEGGLQDIHGSLWKISVLFEQLDDSNTNNRAIIQEQIDRWITCVTFLAKYCNYDGWHGLCAEEIPGQEVQKLEVPTGWYSCHRIAVPIYDMTAEGLGFTEENRYQTAAVKGAISKCSHQRSIFGAWQNCSEHIISLCEDILEGKSVAGNAWTDDADGNHILTTASSTLERAKDDIENRIKSLRQKKVDEADTLQQADIDAINELNCGMSILIDLLKTSMDTVPYVRLADGEWTKKVEIGENNMPYSYKLEYHSFASQTTDVCLVDHIEKGDITAFAGVVTGVELSGAGDGVKVYVVNSQGEGSSPTDLPSALKEEGGNWQLINDPDSYGEWKYITDIAFDFGNRVFDVEKAISPDSGVSVEIRMLSSYNGKPGCGNEIMTEEGYTLYYTCHVYQRTTTGTEIVKQTSKTETEVLIKYDTEELTRPVPLPTTGGHGTMPFHMAGFTFLAVGICMTIFRRRDEEEPLF